jgi:hypothetical protein
MKTKKKEGKRVPLNMRTTETLRNKIENAASISGRSLVQEVEARLELSFATDERTAAEFGNSEKYQIYRMLSAAAETIEFREGNSWLKDKEVATKVSTAWKILLAQILPSLTTDHLTTLIENSLPLPPIPEKLPEIPIHPLVGSMSQRLKNIANLDIEKEKKELSAATTAYSAELLTYHKKIAAHKEYTEKTADILERQKKQIEEWANSFTTSVSEGVQSGQSVFSSNN